MRNTNLDQDFRNICANTDDMVVPPVVREARRYIEFLEDKEDRLTQIEGVLNDIESQPNSATFLGRFKEFKSA